MEDGRLEIVREMILSDTDEATQHALDSLAPLQRGDFEGILEGDERPAGHDPPARPRRLHEFLPDSQELYARLVELEDDSSEETAEIRRQLRVVEGLEEANPMLGLRGCRLGIVRPRTLPDAGEGHRRGGESCQGGRPRSSGRDHGSPRRLPAGTRGGSRGDRGRGGRCTRTREPAQGWHHDRVAAGLRGGGQDRRRSRLLLLRHQRPHPDHLRPSPATTPKAPSSPGTWKAASSPGTPSRP